MNLDHLRRKPYNLTDAQLDWVAGTFAAMTVEQKLGQILLPLLRDLSEEAIDAALKYEVGGLSRLAGKPDVRESARYAQSRTRIPLLMPCDIEFGEKASVGGGTAHTNHLGVAATDDPKYAARMGLLAAQEGSYGGYNITWTPVVDLALNHRSNVVNTRSFGDRTDRVADMAKAYLDGIAGGGFISCCKHFPGDGLDERDQHFVTTHNTLDLEAWWDSFGKIYRGMIDHGVQTIMVGHITLPAYTASLGSGAKAPAHMPATLNADITLGLLRGELGFNGVIVSDATGMGGFSSQGDRKDLVPLCIQSGCDILLFPNDIETDLGYLRNGLDTGALTIERVDDAVTRILGLKVCAGLVDRVAVPEEGQKATLFASKEHARWSEEVAERSLTLVKDAQNILPLKPKTHRRLLICQQNPRMSPSGPMPDLQVGELLSAAGFEVTYLEPGQNFGPETHDAALYLFADEGVSAKLSTVPDWEKLHGYFPLSMVRLWDRLPTVCVSLGSPFLLFHMPAAKTFVNAYSAVPQVQQALVKALMGDIPFTGVSPVDAFCGLDDAKA